MRWNYGCSAHRVRSAPPSCRREQGRLFSQSPRWVSLSFRCSGRVFPLSPRCTGSCFSCVIWLVPVSYEPNDDGLPQTLWSCWWGFGDVVVWLRTQEDVVQSRTVAHNIASLHGSVPIPCGKVPCERLQCWHCSACKRWCGWYQAPVALCINLGIFFFLYCVSFHNEGKKTKFHHSLNLM